MKRTLIIAAVAIATSLSASTLGLQAPAPKVTSKDLSEVRSKASASAYEVIAQHPELKSLVVRK
ncbi:MAG: hypothetical protein HYW07_21680 [Candidatus Latescibacteria bacterium]|nr:hypothetical protein [Candidatus Latescibacterota bacterium]